MIPKTLRYIATCYGFIGFLLPSSKSELSTQFLLAAILMAILSNPPKEKE